jgi:tetratricopeptide (TPR) repeat protein
MRVGDAWPLIIYVLYTGLNQLYSGNRKGFLDCIQKLDEISESFDNTHAKAQYFRLGISGFYRCRELEKTIEFGEHGRTFISKTGHTGMLLVVLSYKAQAHLLLGQVEEARKNLEDARPLYARHKIISSYNVPFLLAEVQMKLQDLRSNNPINGTQKHISKSLIKDLNLLIKKSSKIQSVFTEAYKLKAEAYWLQGKYKKAIRNFDLSVASGLKYNTRVDLARTYFSLGRCLQDPACKGASASRSSGNEYLLKARAMFDELDMKWDMERFEAYMDSR